MNSTSAKNLPWDLISGSLCNSLSAEDELRLRQWLDSDPSNREAYDKLREMWDKGVEDYNFYRLADENKSWEKLRINLAFENNRRITDHKSYNKKFLFYRIAAAAAVVLIVFLGFIYISSKSRPAEYMAARGEQKSVLLTDGTTVTLMQSAHIKLLKGYNKENRTVNLTYGRVMFDIAQQDEIPFLVKAGDITVKDIGTTFTIDKGSDTVFIEVASGIIEVSSNITNEFRKLTAGMSLAYSTTSQTFNVTGIEEVLQDPKPELPVFLNTPLSKVAVALQNTYGKTIVINDKISNKKLTAKLQKMEFTTALEIICESLDLKYAITTDSLYILTEK